MATPDYEAVLAYARDFVDVWGNATNGMGTSDLDPYGAKCFVHMMQARGYLPKDKVATTRRVPREELLRLFGREEWGDVSASHRDWLAQGGEGGVVETVAAEGAPAGIAVVDLAADDAGARLLESLQATGFAYIRNHGIEEGVVARAFGMSQRLFSDDDYKLIQRCIDLFAKRMQMPDNPYMKCAPGYIPFQGEALNASLRGDLKEAFDYTSYHSKPAAAHRPACATAVPQNIWPPEGKGGAVPAGFRTACEEFISESEKVAERVLALLCDAIGLSGEERAEFLGAFADPLVVSRLLRYSPQDVSGVTHVGQMGAGSHVDYGALTLIAQTSAGLEVLCKEGSGGGAEQEGKWVQLPVIPGTLVVNTGYMLEKLTNGALPATKHRVINRQNDFRYSLAVFFDPNPAAVVAPMRHFTAPTGGAARYAPCAAGQKGVLSKKAAQHPSDAAQSAQHQQKKKRKHQQQQQCSQFAQPTFGMQTPPVRRHALTDYWRAKNSFQQQPLQLPPQPLPQHHHHHHHQPPPPPLPLPQQHHHHHHHHHQPLPLPPQPQQHHHHHHHQPQQQKQKQQPRQRPQGS